MSADSSPTTRMLADRRGWRRPHPGQATSRTGIIAIVCALLLPLVPAAAVAAVAGSLDPTFGTGGTVETNLNLHDEEQPPISEAHDVAVDANGRIVVVGDSTFPDALFGPGPHPTRFAVMRYHPNGAVDWSFTDPWDEAVVTDFAGEGDRARAVVIQPDGRIVVGGSATVDGQRHFALARYLEDGTLDTGFGEGGKVVTPWPNGESQIRAMVVLPNERIVAAGWVLTASGQEMAVARYRPDGSLDTSFGDGGRNSVAVADLPSAAFDLARQPDGRLIVAGSADGNIALARFLGNGNLDVGFGDGGGVITTAGADAASANAVAVRANGGIVVAGSALTSLEDDEDLSFLRDVVLVSYLADGSPDPWFGIDSVVTRDVTGPLDATRGLEIDAAGRLVVASTGSGRFAVTRFFPHGDVDHTFGEGGSTLTAAGGGRVAEGLALQPDGKAIVVGHRPNPWDNQARDFALARFTAITQPALDLDILVTPRRDPIDSIVGSARDPQTGQGVPGVRLRFLVDGEVVGIADTDGDGRARAPLPRRGLNATSTVRLEMLDDAGREAGGIEARYHPRTGIDTRDSTRPR